MTDWAHKGWHKRLQICYPPGGGGNILCVILNILDSSLEVDAKRISQTNEYRIQPNNKNIHLWHPEQMFHVLPDLRDQPCVSRAREVRHLLNQSSVTVMVMDYQDCAYYIEALNRLKNSIKIRPVNQGHIDLSLAPKKIGWLLTANPLVTDYVLSAKRRYYQALRYVDSPFLFSYHKLFVEFDKAELNRLKNKLTGNDITPAEYSQCREILFDYMQNNSQKLLDFIK